MITLYLSVGCSHIHEDSVSNESQTNDVVVSSVDAESQDTLVGNDIISYVQATDDLSVSKGTVMFIDIVPSFNFDYDVETFFLGADGSFKGVDVYEYDHFIQCDFNEVGLLYLSINVTNVESGESYEETIFLKVVSDNDFFTLSEHPYAKNGLVSFDSSTLEITLSWDDIVLEGFSHFELFQLEKGGNHHSLSKIYSGVDSSFSVSVEDGKEYTYFLRALYEHHNMSSFVSIDGAWKHHVPVDPVTSVSVMSYHNLYNNHWSLGDDVTEKVKSFGVLLSLQDNQVLEGQEVKIQRSEINGAQTITLYEGTFNFSDYYDDSAQPGKRYVYSIEKQIGTRVSEPLDVFVSTHFRNHLKHISLSLRQTYYGNQLSWRLPYGQRLTRVIVSRSRSDEAFEDAEVLSSSTVRSSFSDTSATQGVDYTYYVQLGIYSMNSKTQEIIHPPFAINSL